jgi:predicted  nucleic acid-binding Zn-ribbon protein
MFVSTAKLQREGEALAAKVAQLEATLKRVRAEKKDLESTRTDLKSRLASTEQLLERKVDRLKQYAMTTT